MRLFIEYATPEVEKLVKLKSKVAGVEIVGSPNESSKEESPEKMSGKPPDGDTGDSCIISGSDRSVVQMDAAAAIVVALAVNAAMVVGIVVGTS
jgi:hypothetical protein